MPKLPILKVKQLLKALKKLGFFEHRQRGTSHLIMADQNGKRTTVPVHSNKDIPTGTLKAILRDLNISTETLIKALNK
ncbi:MAG: type II toxin-antitoxin system HicA family toxin [bacterium]|nr:type II toxin-antitoxin system HicA family toxin [bacterium]